MSSYQNYLFQYFLNENYIVNFLMLNRNIKVYHHFNKNIIVFISPWGLSWSYGSWIYNYTCNQCLSPLTWWVQTLLRWGVLDTTLCDQVYQWLAAGLWFSLGGVKHQNQNPPWLWLIHTYQWLIHTYQWHKFKCVEGVTTK